MTCNIHGTYDGSVGVHCPSCVAPKSERGLWERGTELSLENENLRAHIQERDRIIQERDVRIQTLSQVAERVTRERDEAVNDKTTLLLRIDALSREAEHERKRADDAAAAVAKYGEDLGGHCAAEKNALRAQIADLKKANDSWAEKSKLWHDQTGEITSLRYAHELLKGQRDSLRAEILKKVQEVTDALEKPFACLVVGDHAQPLPAWRWPLAWRPAITVPKGGERVLIYTTNQTKPFDVAYSPYDPAKPFTTIDGEDEVTHWMPLPEAPK